MSTQLQYGHPPHITAPQGVTSETWKAPPFERDLSVPELYAFHAKNSPEHPAFAFDMEDGEVRDVTYAEMYGGIRKAAGWIFNIMGQIPPGADDAKAEKVVGILAKADSPTILTLLVGIMYAGLTAFPISVRNSPAAVAHLVRVKGVHELLVSSDAAMQELAHQAKTQLAKEGYELALAQMPQFSDFFNDDKPPEHVQMATIRPDGTGLIIHSSGSTAFPKPIPITHITLSRDIYRSWYGQLDICGYRISSHMLPFFHIVGVLLISYACGCGAIPTFFRPSSPPVIPTPDTVLESARRTGCNSMLCMPSIIEAWAQDPEAITFLKSLEFLVFGGAPLKEHVGKDLQAKGVKLASGYGTTETAGLGRHFLDLKQEFPLPPWEWFVISPAVEHVRRYQDGQSGIFELVVLQSPSCMLNVCNTVADGRQAYATSDLFIEHPVHTEYIQLYGRADDQIVLSTGEKTNPVPLESILLQDSHISAALMIGHGRFQNGVIIHPKEPFDPFDDIKLEEYRNKIWSSIERANAHAPSHSRIFKEMIMVTTPSKPFEYTPKGTPRRHVCIKNYADEIDALYNRVEGSSQIDVEPPSQWDDSTVKAYVRAVVKQIMKAPHIADDQDLFQQGCDSLQATWIRNTILHAVRMTTKRSIHNVPLNLVYNSPTIGALSSSLITLLSGQAIDEEAERAARLADMASLVEKYGSGFPKPLWSPPSDETAPRETVLITGTTGRLGSHLLAKLLQNPAVAHVFALNRAASRGSVKLAERQQDAFKMWGLDAALLGSKVAVLQGDLLKPRFGLAEDIFQEMQRTVTVIIHNAWRVDFKVSLTSYEPLIRGARKLVDFALQSPIHLGPRLLFVSSVSALANHKSSEIARETLENGPETALGLGYGESKWVTEQILARAARDTGLRTTSVRVGQLCGDTRIGGWGVKEWVPALTRASKLLGCVPERQDTVSWAPVDTAASALLEMVQSNERILHLLAPRPAVWNDIFGLIAVKLALPIVPVDDWLAKLQDSAREAEQGNIAAEGVESAYVLLQFFESFLSNPEMRLKTVLAVKASHSLAGMSELGREDTERWISLWQSVRFL